MITMMNTMTMMTLMTMESCLCMIVSTVILASVMIIVMLRCASLRCGAFSCIVSMACFFYCDCQMNVFACMCMCISCVWYGGMKCGGDACAFMKTCANAHDA